jgi:hypothetical protein
MEDGKWYNVSCPPNGLIGNEILLERDKYKALVFCGINVYGVKSDYVE